MTEEEQLDKAYADCFLSASGREVLKDLTLAHFEVPTFRPGENEGGLALAFREGQRSVVLSIRAAMRRGMWPDEHEMPETSLGDPLDEL